MMISFIKWWLSRGSVSLLDVCTKPFKCVFLTKLSEASQVRGDKKIPQYCNELLQCACVHATQTK